VLHSTNSEIYVTHLGLVRFAYSKFSTWLKLMGSLMPRQCKACQVKAYDFVVPWWPVKGVGWGCVGGFGDKKG